MYFPEDSYIKRPYSAANIMAADYSEEPKCTQKGTGWVTFDTSPRTRKKKTIRKVIRKMKL